ncbi:MAG TPA: Hpt domain-containing protein [Spirochaetota bacterium]|nr:Hpt domain-containing protein [Spirochaetota bacterium]
MNDLNLDAFNYNELLDRFMGEKDVVDDVIRVFISKIDKQFEVIEENINTLDIDKVRFEAHNIKGGALNLSANLFGQEAKNLEEACKKNRKDKLGAIFSELKMQFENFKKELIKNNIL